MTRTRSALVTVALSGALLAGVSAPANAAPTTMPAGNTWTIKKSPGAAPAGNTWTIKKSPGAVEAGNTWTIKRSPVATAAPRVTWYQRWLRAVQLLTGSPRR